jgi:anti-anti-sigma factor
VRLADLSIESIDRIIVARLEGEIDLSNAADLGATIATRVPNDALRVVIDLTGVDYVDSAGIHVLFNLRNRLRTRGQELSLVVPPGAEIFEALRIAFVPQVVRVYKSVEEAAGAESDERTRDH